MIDHNKVDITSSIYEWSKFYDLMRTNFVHVKPKMNHFGVLKLEKFEMKNSLKFEIRYHDDGSIKRVEMQLSLHKYFANGFNYNNYTFRQLCSTIIDLCYTYGLNPHKAILQNVEIGANVILNISVQDFIDGLYISGFKPFEAMSNRFGRSIGVKASLTDYSIKGYYKSKQLAKVVQLPNNIYRHELHYDRMRKVNEIGIYTLADLMDYKKMNRFSSLLLSSLDQLIHYSDEIKKGQYTKSERQLLRLWSNPKTIQKLAKKNPQKFRKHRRVFQRLSWSNSTFPLPTLRKAINTSINNNLSPDLATLKQVEYYLEQFNKKNVFPHSSVV